MQTVKLGLGLACVSLLLACGSESKVLPKIDQFEAKATQLVSGEKAELSWRTSGASEVSLEETAGGDTKVHAVKTEGSFTSKALTESTQFVLVAKNKDGSVRSEPIAIQLVPLKATLTPSQTEVNKRETFKLSYRVLGEGPLSVQLSYHPVSDPEAITPVKLVDATALEGEAELLLKRSGDYRFTLKVMNNNTEASTETTIKVRPDTEPPVIAELKLNPSSVPFGDNVEVLWKVENADEVQVSVNGKVSRKWVDVDRGHAVQLLVNQAEMNIKLEARNEKGTVEKSVVATGVEGVKITRFEVSPESFWTQTVEATVSWAVENADSVTLEIDGQPVQSDPPFKLQDSYRFEAKKAALLVLTATNKDGLRASREIQLRAGYDEPEPNNSLAEAIQIVPNGIAVRGTLSDDADHDFYVVDLPVGQRLYVSFGQTGGACQVNQGQIRLRNSSNVLLGEVLPEKGCAVMKSLLHPFADVQQAGRYYIEVSRTPGVTRSPSIYGLEVLASAIPGRFHDPSTTPSRGEVLAEGPPFDATTMPWRVGDVLQVQLDEDTFGGKGSKDEVLRSAALSNALYPFFVSIQTAPQSILDVLFPGYPYTVSPQSDFLRRLTAAPNLQAKTVFSLKELEKRNGPFLSNIALLILLEPNPDMTSPVSTATREGMLPSIPESIYPIRINLDVKNAASLTEWGDTPVSVIFPSYRAHADDDEGSWQWDKEELQVQNPGVGHSFRLIAAYLNPFFLKFSGGAGNYLWTLQLSDAQNRSYRVNVPFTLVP